MQKGSLNLIEQAAHKIDNETLSKLIIPLKRALYTHDEFVIRRVLSLIQKLARANESAIGILLVPYFKQLLPIFNILKERYERKLNQHEQDCYVIDDYQTDESSDLLRLINQTLVVLEQSGGQDAFINIKYLIPTYEQQADIKQLSTAQLNMAVKPILDL